jgi:CheY-like chemotaxis protein
MAVSPRVIVVDDDRGFGDFVRKVALSCGYEVEVATEAAGFQQLYGARSPDLIMLDLQMPGTDGIELLRSLAEQGCKAPILVMSGFDAKVVDTARRLGEARGLNMPRVITKPIRAADLRSILNGFLEEFGKHAS